MFTDSDKNFAFTGNGPLTVFINPDPSYDPQFVFTSQGEDFTTSTTTGISTINTTTATITTYTIATTTNDN